MQVQSAPMREFLLYFLRLGAFGFGGPIALCGYMQRDLVEQKRWISEEDYVEGLALAQLAPGPLAAQLAIYLGWIRAGFWGATGTGLAFVLPSFLMVLALSAVYVRFGGLPWMQGAFYGVGAAVIAIIARSAWKLTKLTLKKDRLLWGISAASTLVTAWTEQEIVWLFLLAGALVLAVRARGTTTMVVAPFLLTGLQGVASSAILVQILWVFAAAGAVVFGSGLAIVPFLRGAVVVDHHWLTDQQFLDAVAVAMITPGPVVITVAFIGYLVAGPLGAVVAALGVFLPCWLLVVGPASFFRRHAKNPKVHAFVDGVTAAATGAIAGAAMVLGKRAIYDLPTLLVALAALLALWRMKKVPEPMVILTAGVAGLALRSLP